MKWYVTLLFLLFARHSYAQNTYFEWVNPADASRERIEVGSKKHLKEVKPGVWETVKQLAIDPTIFKDLPPNFSNQFFNVNKGKNIWFTIEGTGMVYQFTPATSAFVRIDHTYYRGCNFSALQFVRQNKLYSLGGYGFWAHNRNLTCFNVNQKEWDLFRTNNLGPEAVNIGYNGYSAKADVIFAGASEIKSNLVEMKEVFDDRLFVFDFKKLSWTMLGHINPELPFKKKWDVCWDGENFIQFAEGNLYLIDPIANNVQVVEDNTQSFSPIYNYDRFFKKGDTIHLYRGNSGVVLKLAKNDLLKKAKYIGPFYTNKSPYIWIVIGSFVVLVGLGIAFMLFKRKRKLKLRFASDFDQMELDLIQHLVPLAENAYLTNNEMNDILGLNDKSQDNQRKIKMNLINQINQKIEMKYQVKDAICRISISEDKRLKAYYMKKEAVALFNK